ncbi:hypothetical protein BGX31_009518 [Mortierella sp. GBA43]|nr:hypothetical protein BGX31_009518 [Mortierella sp. GBA43]
MQDDSADYGAIPARDSRNGSSSNHANYGSPRQSRDGERTWLLSPQSATTGSGSGSGSGAEPRRRNTWFSQGPQHNILPTHVAGSAPDLLRRSKDLPGRTADPKDPLYRSALHPRTNIKLSRQDTHKSTLTAASFNSKNTTSISERRNQLNRQNSHGEVPNRFMAFFYWIKDLMTSPDTTDEKVTSTILNVVNVCVDVTFCFFYLVEANAMTRPEGHESDWLYINRSRSFWHVLVGIAIYNILCVFFSIAFSDSKGSSIRSVRHIVSTLVALPFVFSLFIKNGHELYVPYFLQSIPLVSRLQQALNFYIDIGVTDLPMDPLKSKTITFAMYILTLIYCAVSAFQVAEYDQLVGGNDHNNLLKLLYFVLITMSTIGYGDVTPKSQLGYAIVVLVITAVITVVPWMISGITDALAQAQAGEGSFKSGGHKFMVISGSFHSALKLANVLNGFWFTNKEYSNASFKLVILGLSEPSKDIQALLQSARYKNRVVYLKGSPLERNDLERVQARYAEGIFVIADRNSPNEHQEEDRHNTLSTVAFRNASDSGIYTYNLLPETEIYQKNAATQVVCADELRQVLLGFNCLQQATATLILNMLHQHRPSEKFSEAWQAEYDDSLGNEFYVSYLNPIFDGKPFGFVSWFLYRRFQVILLGITIRLQSGEHHTALNPGKEYLFQHNEQCIFIAQNPTDLDDINELTEKNLENFLEHLHETFKEDCDAIGFDYHAKDFLKALHSLSPSNPGKHRMSRSSRQPLNGGGDLSFGRKSGRYHVQHTTLAATNDDDDIDVEPEVSLMSGDESGPEGGHGSQPSLTTLVQPDVSPEVTREARRAAARDARKKSAEQKFRKELTVKKRFQDDEPESLRIDYPTAPFRGAKVPLCILVSAQCERSRKLPDMEIRSWGDLLEERRQRTLQAEAERANLNTEPNAEDNAGDSAPQSGPKTRRGSRRLSKSVPNSGHILICSPNYDIFRLICTLRSAHVKQLHDIVILCSREPTQAEFKVLRCFPRLYFLIGDCLSRDDLERGSITTSSKYLFLRHPENAGVDGAFFDSVAVINRILVQQIFTDEQKRTPQFGTLTDTVLEGFSTVGSIAMPLPSTRRVSPQSLNEGPQCVYELVEERSVEFLQVRKTDSGHEHVHAIGHDTPCGPNEACRMDPDSGYYGNTQLRRKPAADTGPSDFYHNPIYASGGVIVGGLLDHVLYQLYSNPSILQLIKLLCGIRTKADVKRDLHLFKQYGAGCYLECIPMPEGFGVRTMGVETSHPNDSDESSDSEGTSSKQAKDMEQPSSLSRAATIGKQRISELFHQAQEHLGHGGSDSIDSDYMYDNRHKNFLHLYEHLALDRGMIPIGLLRLQGDDIKTVHLGIGGSSRCYAITNPLLDTIILDTDQVFVLTRESMK